MLSIPGALVSVLRRRGTAQAAEATADIIQPPQPHRLDPVCALTCVGTHHVYVRVWANPGEG